MFTVLNRRLIVLALPLVGWAMVSCEGFRIPAFEKLKAAETTENSSPAPPPSPTPAGDVALGTDTSPVDLGFLLSMNYAEAKALAGNGMDLGQNGRVAAENIEVVRQDKEGQPRKVRAKGKVYLEAGAGDSAKILCQEAYINGDEAVLRGRPILQRGGTIIEGLADDTVFYFLGSRLRVIGLHRVTNPDTMLAGMPDLGPWTAGPNPLLPALNENAVPMNVREEMLKAATAEAVLQQNKHEALKQTEGAPAPWVKPGT